jgi:parallel beta-helix repeat protein
MNTTARSFRRYLFAASLLLAGGLIALAGPLNPPAGPVSPTYKTLGEVEPRIAISAATTPGDADSVFKISLPGSYYLTGNFQGVTAKHGIEIAASGVTVDLNGFEILGVPGSLDGISATLAGIKNLCVHSGSILAWGDRGIDFATGGVLGSSVRDVRATFNGTVGIAAGAGGSLSGCTASNNGTHGFAVGAAAVVTGCTAVANGGSGFSNDPGVALSGCAASDNGSHGFLIGAVATVSGCTAYSNTADGFAGTSDVTLTGCTADRNGRNGIWAPATSVVSGCSALYNAADGIKIGDQCLVLGNTCAENGTGPGGGAGIHVTNIDNRIEGNTCISATRGIHVDAGGNLIFRNSCADNTTNWVLAAGNVFGPILDRTAPGSAAVSGNSAPDSTGSTNQNANFSF